MPLTIINSIFDQLWPEVEPGDKLPPEVEIEDIDDLPAEWVGTIVWVKIAGRDCRGWIAAECEYNRTHHVLIQPLEGFTIPMWQPSVNIIQYEWHNIIDVMQTAS